MPVWPGQQMSFVLILCYCWHSQVARSPFGYLDICVFVTITLLLFAFLSDVSDVLLAYAAVQHPVRVERLGRQFLL